MATTHDVYSYHFAQVPDNSTVEQGVGHFDEVAFVFSNPLPTRNPLSTRPGDKELASLMTSCWCVSYRAKRGKCHKRLG
jgi:acetylcholinesterase